MSSIDNKVVSLNFDNSQFQAGMAETMRSIEQMTATIQQFNANNGFAGLQAQADSVNLEQIGVGVDNISSKFDAMGVVAFSVLQRISNAAIDAGRGVVQGLLNPLIEGGRTRALQIEQAQFLFKGLGMDVEATMNSALDAVRGTAYGLGEAATLAGVFGAAGIDSGEQMTRALRGVAGVAAITGRSFSEMGGIFQNIAALGKVTTNDLNSFALRGLGIGKIAEAMGVTVEELRQMAMEGSIDFETFSNKMEEAFGDHSVRANETFTGSLANLRAALSRIGADAFTTTFAGLRVIFNALSPAIDKVHEALGPLLETFKRFVSVKSINIANFFEGLDFEKLTAALKWVPDMLLGIYHVVMNIARPIKDAFTDIFPMASVQQLHQIGRAVRDFIARLAIGQKTAHQVRNVFRGLFSILSIGWSIIKGIAGVLGAFISGLSGGASATLGFAGGLGKMLMHLKEILVDGGAIEDFFASIADKVRRFMAAVSNSGPIQAFSDAIHDMGRWFSQLFGERTSSDIDGVDTRFGRLSDRLDSITAAGDRLSGAWDRIKQGFQRLGDFLMGYIDRVKESFSGWWESLKESFSEGNFDAIGDMVNVGLVGALTGVFWQLTHGGLNINVMSSLVFRIKNMFQELTITLRAMQMELRARALLKIAEAVGILTISMVALSLIDSAALTKALLAMSVGMTMLVGVMASLNAVISGPSSVAKLDFLGIALIALSTALVIFAGALAIFGTMENDTIARGLIAIAGSLAVLGIAAKLLEGVAPSMSALGLALIPLAIGLGLVAGALALFSVLDTGVVAESLLKIAASLAVLGVAAWLLESVIPQMSALGLALIPLAFGLGLVAGALAIFGLMDPGVVAESLLEIAGALAVLGVAALLLGPVIPQMALLGAALIPMALGLASVAAVLAGFAAIGLENIAIGLLGVVGALAILGAGSLLLSNVTPMMALLGVSLLPLAAGLAATAVAIGMFASIGFGDLLLGLLGIALSFTVLGVAATLLSETIPFIAAFGAALILVAGAFALFGAGAYLLAESFRITVEGLRGMARFGPEAFDAIIDGAKKAVTVIPDLLSELARGVLAFIDTFASGLPNTLSAIWEVLDMLLEQFLKVITENAGPIAEAVIAVIDAILTVVNEKAPAFIATGFMLLVSLLQGINENIGQITLLVSQIILNFLTALTEQIPMLVVAGQNFLVALLQGIGANIGFVVTAAYQVVIGFINGIAANIGGVVTAAVNLVVAFINGVANNIGRIIDAGGNLIIKFIKGIGAKALEVADAAADTIVTFMEGLETSIRTHSGEIEDAAAGIGDAILDGIGNAIDRGRQALVDKIKGMAGGLIGGALGALGINSPSKEFLKIGQSIVEGLGMGIDDHDSAIGSITSMSENVISRFTEMVATVSDELATVGALSPTITPVLDLTGVTNDARQLSSILGTRPISATVSAAQARNISETRSTPDDVAQVSPGSEGTGEVTFIQNNYARDELTLDELYTQTKSQIHLFKKEFDIR